MSSVGVQELDLEARGFDDDVAVELDELLRGLRRRFVESVVMVTRYLEDASVEVGFEVADGERKVSFSQTRARRDERDL